MPTAQAQHSDDNTKSEELPISKKQIRKLRPTYLNIGIGNNSSKFRDFATSPLFYNGSAIQILISRLKKDNLRESELGLTYDFGNYSTTFNENTTVSAVKRVELFYSRLYRVNQLSSNRYNTKIGFQVNGTGNLRINEGLLNNAFGLETFANLIGSIKFTKDISRKQPKEKKIGFIKYKLIEKKSDIAFRLNVGLINSSFRNGYIYNGQSGIINKADNFENYQFKIFSGFRMGSRLDYTRYLKNKNAIQLSYIWDAYKTGGELDKFEMAHHTLRFTLLFNTNNH